jgi:hypothetical protein
MFHHLDLTTVIAADRRRDFTRAADERRRARPAPIPMRWGRPTIVEPVATTGHAAAVPPTATTPAAAARPAA